MTSGGKLVTTDDPAFCDCCGCPCPPDGCCPNSVATCPGTITLTVSGIPAPFDNQNGTYTLSFDSSKDWVWLDPTNGAEYSIEGVFHFVCTDGDGHTWGYWTWQWTIAADPDAGGESCGGTFPGKSCCPPHVSNSNDTTCDICDGSAIVLTISA